MILMANSTIGLIFDDVFIIYDKIHLITIEMVTILENRIFYILF